MVIKYGKNKRGNKNEHRRRKNILKKKLFDEIKNEDLIEISPNKRISKKFLLSINNDSLENLYIYAKVISIFKKEKGKCRITYKSDPQRLWEDSEEIDLSKKEIVIGLRKIAKEEEYKDKVNSILEELEPYCTEECFLEKYQDEVYSKEIDGTNYRISFKDIWNFVNLPEEQYQDLIKQNIINGIPKEKYIYAAVSFFRQNPIFNNYFINETVSNRYEELSKNKIIDIEAINQLNKTYNPNLPKIKIDPSLREKVLENMPTTLSPLEKAIYIYIKLCKILTYDDEVFATNNREDETKLTRQHQDIRRLNKITPDNSKIVCYEFNAIYGKLLEEIGVHHEIYEGFLGDYGEGHSNLIFRVGKQLIVADSVESMINGDLSNVKINSEITGLKSINKNQKTKEEFQKTLKKVYDYIIITEKEEKGKNIDDYLEEYRKLKKDNNNLTPEEKIKIIIEIIKNTKLPDLDQLAFIHYFFKNILSDEDRKIIKPIFIGDNRPTNGNKIMMTNVVIVINNDNSKKYFLYRPNISLEEIELEELQRDFDNKRLEYIFNGKEHIIPGINDRQRRRRR